MMAPLHEAGLTINLGRAFLQFQWWATASRSQGGDVCCLPTSKISHYSRSDWVISHTLSTTAAVTVTLAGYLPWHVTGLSLSATYSLPVDYFRHKTFHNNHTETQLIIPITFLIPDIQKMLRAFKFNCYLLYTVFANRDRATSSTEPQSHCV